MRLRVLLMPGRAGGRRVDPDLGRWVDVARESWQAQVGAVRSSLHVARSAATGRLDPVAATRAYVRGAFNGAERYWRDASRLGAEHALGLARAGQQAVADLLDEVAAARRRPAGHPTGRAAAAAAPTAAGPRAASGAEPATASTSSTAPALTLHGRLGERAAGSLTVANRHPRARRVELRAGTVVDADGADVVGAVLDLDPTRTTVPAGGEAVVALSLELVPGLFTVGENYLVTVEVRGGDDATVVCTVVVDR